MKFIPAPASAYPVLEHLVAVAVVVMMAAIPCQPDAGLETTKKVLKACTMEVVHLNV